MPTPADVSHSASSVASDEQLMSGALPRASCGRDEATVCTDIPGKIVSISHEGRKINPSMADTCDMAHKLYEQSLLPAIKRLFDDNLATERQVTKDSEDWRTSHRSQLWMTKPLQSLRDAQARYKELKSIMKIPGTAEVEQDAQNDIMAWVLQTRTLVEKANQLPVPTAVPTAPSSRATSFANTLVIPAFGSVPSSNARGS